MNDLVTWLWARLDEDERLAKEATSGPWTADTPMAKDAVRSLGASIGEFEAWVADCRYESMGPLAVSNARHIALHDPARVLAEVEAKRRLLDWLVALEGKALDGNWWNIEVSDAIKLLALPYADRPGYDESWRP